MKYGGIAQLGEHLLCKQGVVGSIPSASTTRQNANESAQRRKRSPREVKSVVIGVFIETHRSLTNEKPKQSLKGLAGRKVQLNVEMIALITRTRTQKAGAWHKHSSLDLSGN